MSPATIAVSRRRFQTRTLHQRVEVGDAIAVSVADGRMAARFESYGLSFHPPQW